MDHAVPSPFWLLFFHTDTKVRLIHLQHYMLDLQCLLLKSSVSIIEDEAYTAQLTQGFPGAAVSRVSELTCL